MTLDEAAASRGLGRMLEDSLAAPFNPGAIFDALAASPAPSYARMAAAVSVSAAAFLAINLGHARLAYPDLMGYGGFWLGFGALWLLIAGVIASFAGAGLVHIVSRLLGGGGGFNRSYQIVTVSSGLAVYQAILNWFPALWPLPFISAAIIAAIGLQKLHATPGRPTWAAAAILCALTLSAVEAALRAARHPAIGAVAEVSQAARLLQQAPQAAPAPGLTPPPAMPTIPLGGLSLAQAPQDQRLPAAPEPPEPIAAPTVRGADPQLQAIMAGPMGMLNQMMSNPAMTKGMPPEQVKQFRELIGILNELQAASKGGKPLTDEQTKRMTRALQEANARLMGDLSRPQTPKKEKKK